MAGKLLEKIRTARPQILVLNGSMARGLDADIKESTISAMSGSVMTSNLILTTTPNIISTLTALRT